jgi:DNA-binding transcriptional LysR family regulator
MLRRRLPSTNSLFVFEAVARTASFSTAARELGVTQPAISNTIAKLERHLGIKLFERRGTRIRLSPKGEALFPAVASGWAAIETAIDEICRPPGKPEQITLSCSASQMVHWLMPRLPKFHAEFPDVDLQFQFTGNDPDGFVGDVDLAFRYGGSLTDDLYLWPMIEEVIYAVCSPQYRNQHGMLEAARVNPNHTFISITNPRVSWAQFWRDLGLPKRARWQVESFPDYSVVIHTAANGQGIALGWLSSVVSLMMSGLLVPAYPIPLETKRSYYLVASKHRPVKETTLKLKDWLIAEMQRDIATLSEELPPAPG